MAAVNNLSEVYRHGDDRTFQPTTRTMSKAIDQIVDAYVRLNNGRGLQDLRMHRQRLVVDLRLRTGYDFSLPIGQINEEIVVIEAGSKGSTALTAHERVGAQPVSVTVSL